MSRAEYLQVFIDESNEHLQKMNENLLELEKAPTEISFIGEVFRSAHTLKGMAATMEYNDLAKLTHAMENVFEPLRNGTLTATSSIFDVVFEATDDLEAMIMDVSKGGNGKKNIQHHIAALENIYYKEGGEVSVSAATEAEVSPFQITYDEFERTLISQSAEEGFTAYEIKVSLDVQTMLKAARAYMVFQVLEDHGEVIKSEPTVEELEEENFEFTFIVTFLSKRTAAELSQLIYKISEIVEVEIHTIDRAGDATDDTEDSEDGGQPDLPATQLKTEPQEVHRTIRVNIDRLDVLMNLFEELLIDRGRLEKISSELNHAGLNETVERMTRVSGDLQEIILNMRMMPVENVFNRFPRMIRKLAKELGKKVELQIVGAEIELDRTIIDEIGDPLVHLLRNSLDHGIEKPGDRIAAGKPEKGSVVLRAYHSGNHVYIEIEDDGAGIDKKKISKQALEKGVITEDELTKMTAEQIYGLLFAPGFSTAEKVTHVSGRGMGLDVVRQTFEATGGVVTVDSNLGKGSVFQIQLPLTLSING